MDTLTNYRGTIERIFEDNARIPFAHGEVHLQVIIDADSGHYLLMLVGYDGIRRVHGCLVHIDIVEGKIWIQRDGTEYGIARELIEAGVPKEDIVLAYKTPEMRQYTEFAVGT